MPKKPVAAGKSSLDHVDQDKTFAHIITQENATYLDLACGAGRYSLALAERLDGGGVIHAFDLWEEGIAVLEESAKKNGLDAIRPKVADITHRLPLEDEIIDVCFIATALHDLPLETRNSVIEEIRRVLVLHGALILIEFKKIDHGPGPGKSKRIGEDDADALVIPHGFEKELSASLGEYTYLAKYAKA